MYWCWLTVYADKNMSELMKYVICSLTEHCFLFLFYKAMSHMAFSASSRLVRADCWYCSDGGICTCHRCDRFWEHSATNTGSLRVKQSRYLTRKWIIFYSRYACCTILYQKFTYLQESLLLHWHLATGRSTTLLFVHDGRKYYSTGTMMSAYTHEQRWPAIFSVFQHFGK